MQEPAAATRSKKKSSEEEFVLTDIGEGVSLMLFGKQKKALTPRLDCRS